MFTPLTAYLTVMSFILPAKLYTVKCIIIFDSMSDVAVNIIEWQSGWFHDSPYFSIWTANMAMQNDIFFLRII